ncbi:MAG: nucleotide exchange factor GrpE [Candidatus Micrarchaeota archaeon]
MLKEKTCQKGDGITDKKDEPGKTDAVPLGGERKAEIAPPQEKKGIAHEVHKMLHPPDREKELEERLARVQAEFENYKKRAAKESEMIRERANADAMMKLIPLVDDFDVAIMHMDKSPHKEFKRGFELIFAKMLDLLKREGVEEMRCLGASFDPYKHDALRVVEGDDGKIVEVIQKGYTLKGNVLRHAKVVVGKGKGEKKEEEIGCEEVD